MLPVCVLEYVLGASHCHWMLMYLWQKTFSLFLKVCLWLTACLINKWMLHKSNQTEMTPTIYDTNQWEQKTLPPTHTLQGRNTHAICSCTYYRVFLFILRWLNTTSFTIIIQSLSLPPNSLNLPQKKWKQSGNVCQEETLFPRKNTTKMY